MTNSPFITMLMLAALAGCAPVRPESSPAPADEAERAPLSDLPATLTVNQRSTSAVPGSENGLRLTLGDVTRGQVEVSLVDEDGQAVLAPVSLREGEAAQFRIGTYRYRLALKELRNVLVGEDSATVEIADFAPQNANESELTEVQKIERLIEHIASLDRAIFIRNGRDHSPVEAADHLRSKLAMAGDRVTTAEEFIEHLATRSSTTGERYEIRFPDGSIAAAGDYMRQRLRALDRNN